MSTEIQLLQEKLIIASKSLTSSPVFTIVDDDGDEKELEQPFGGALQRDKTLSIRSTATAMTNAMFQPSASIDTNTPTMDAQSVSKSGIPGLYGRRDSRHMINNTGLTPKHRANSTLDLSRFPMISINDEASVNDQHRALYSEDVAHFANNAPSGIHICIYYMFYA